MNNAPPSAQNQSTPNGFGNANNSTAQQLRRLGLFGSSGQNTSSSNGDNYYVPFPRMDNSSSLTNTNGSSLNSNPFNLWQEAKDEFWLKVGIVNGAGSTLTYPFTHPINTLEGIANTLYNAGTLALGLDNSGSAKAYFGQMWQGMQNTFNALGNPDPYTRGVAFGTLGGMAVSIPMGQEGLPIIGEMGEVAAARSTFRSAIDPVGAMQRQYAMLEQNVGYNVTPSKVFSMFPSIGKENSLYLTDYEAITGALGSVLTDREYNVGLFTYGNQVSFFRATKLGLGLGLENPYQLNQGFRFSSVEGINQLLPRSPLTGNSLFLGPGVGLYNGGPEVVIDSLPSGAWPWRNRYG